VRLPISEVFNIKGVGQIACGTLEQGILKSGDVVGIAPSGLRGKTISSIQMHKKKLDKACPGFSVGVCIKGISEDEELSTGHVIYVQSEGECKPVKSFTSVVQTRNIDRYLNLGYTPIVVCRSAKVACKMTKIVWKKGRMGRTENETFLANREVALVEFEPTAPLYVEPFEACADLGRLAVMEGNTLIMVGRVMSTTPAE
jgi:elongation factor 1-alpha